MNNKTLILTKEEQAVKDKLLSMFVFMDDAIDLLFLGYKTKTNIIFHGPGGNGKSELTNTFFDLMDTTSPFISTMGSGMNTDRLNGGVDLERFDKTGELHYLVEQSWMNSENVVFEEMMDAPDFVLESMKDTISSGEFRNGMQRWKIKTEFIVCCTNRTRKEFAKNLSLKALCERFPLELEVKWKDYNRFTYETLLNKVSEDKPDPRLTYIMDKLANNDSHIISPRIAIEAHKKISVAGFDCIKFFADFQSHFGKVKEYLHSFKADMEYFVLQAELTEMSEGVKEAIAKLNTGFDPDADASLKEFKKKVDAFGKLKMADDMVAEWTATRDEMKSILDKADKKFQAAKVLNDTLSDD